MSKQSLAKEALDMPEGNSWWQPDRPTQYGDYVVDTYGKTVTKEPMIARALEYAKSQGYDDDVVEHIEDQGCRALAADAIRAVTRVGT
jgi:hypothetical protein